MIKPVNILSLSQVSDRDALRQYQTYLGISFKEHELESMRALCCALSEGALKASAFSTWYVNYSIPQISKEFDLLRFSDQGIVNIELKSTYDSVKISRQLERNRYYLSFLGKPVSAYTFVSDSKQLFSLVEGGGIVETSFTSLIDILDKDEAHEQNLDLLFRPSNYLVSPFNTVHRFVANEYFLTNQQERIMDSITSRIGSEVINASITGRAGTGKTLLVYHLAKHFMSMGKKVLVIHGGNLNSGQLELNESYNWTIIPIKNSDNYLKQPWDIIVIDETQRIWKSQLEQIIEHAYKNDVSIIFGYDPEQTLNSREGVAVDIVQQYCLAETMFTLTNKIRTNTVLSEFINGVFLSKNKPGTVPEDVTILYFSGYPEALEYINSKYNYHYISSTPSRFYHHPIKHLLYNDRYIGTSHGVLGQEFNNVIVVLDSDFFYDDGGNLRHRNNYGTNYLAVKMFFQYITRVREKLEIIVVDNIPVLLELLA